jgi:hypothetical protein
MYIENNHLIKKSFEKGKSIFHTLSAEYFQQMIYKTIMLFRKMRACIYMIYFKKLRMHVYFESISIHLQHAVSIK